MRPFFSVVIPTLDEQEYLPRLLTDLTKQTEKAFEIIVVDGGSTDKTIEKARVFEERLTISIEKVQKGNVSIQRNVGAKKAKGEYLVFFDADVQITPHFLQKLKRKLKEDRCDYATTYLVPDSADMQDKIIAAGYNISMEVSLFIEKNFVSGFNFTVKKKVFDKVNGFRTDVILGEDYELAERLGKLGYTLHIYKSPRLTFSLRRFRAEGRLLVLRKNIQSTIHVFAKGHVIRPLFDYPMGGGWYKNLKNNPKNQLEQFYEKLKVFLIEQ